MSDRAKSTRRGAATRGRIVCAAADLIYTRGLGRATVRSVRRAASVSGSQLNHYFIDKRALVRGVIAFRREEMIDFHTQGALKRLDSFAALKRWADLNVQKQIERDCVGGCAFGSLVGELVVADDVVRADVAEVYDRWTELFTDALTAMRDRGQLRGDADPRHLAAALVAAHQGGALLTQTTRTVEPLRAALYAAVDYVKSFAPRASQPTRRRSRR